MTRQLFLLLVAVVCLVIFTLAEFGVFTVSHALGWLGAGLVAFAAAHLDWPARPGPPA